eukprot:gene1409-32781_t
MNYMILNSSASVSGRSTCPRLIGPKGPPHDQLRSVRASGALKAPYIDGSAALQTGGNKHGLPTDVAVAEISSSFAQFPPGRMLFYDAVDVMLELSKGTDMESELAEVKITPRSYDREGHDQLISQLLLKTRGHLDQLDSRELVSVLRALASMEHQPPEHWICELMETLETRITDLDTEEVVSSLSACATLQVRPQLSWIEVAMEQLLDTTVLSSPTTSAAAVGDGVDTPTNVPTLSALDHISVIQALATMYTVPPQRFLSCLESLSIQHLHEMPLQSLAIMIQSYSTLGYELSRPWLQALGAAALPHLQISAPKGLAEFVSAVAKLRIRGSLESLGPAMMEAVWSRSALLMRENTILLGSFTILVSSLGHLHTRHGIAPPPEWLQACASHTEHLCSSMKTYQLAQILQGMARMRITTLPRFTTLALTTRLLELMHKLTPGQMASISLAFSRLQLPPSRELSEAYRQCIEAFDLRGLGPDVQANLLHGMATLKTTPPVKHQLVILAATYGGMRRANAQDVCSVVVSLARMNFKPDAAWAENALHELRQRLPAFSSVQLSGVAWGLATMGIIPSKEWISYLEVGSVGKLSCFSSK